jgi:hypothetical protein
MVKVMCVAGLIMAMAALCNAGDNGADRPISLSMSADVPTSAPQHESEDEGELAKKLSNPISSLISVPFQSNFNFNAGQDNDKFQYILNIQPVIPIALNQDWNLISRIIQPVIYQQELFPGQGDNFGLGDMNPQFFFSPNATYHGWIWGVGPTFLFPTATDTALGSGQWAAGPVGVVLKQEGPWTYGMLANQLWSFAGDDGSIRRFSSPSWHTTRRMGSA